MGQRHGAADGDSADHLRNGSRAVSAGVEAATLVYPQVTDDGLGLLAVFFEGSSLRAVC